MKESDILYQRGSYWVCASKLPRAYLVMADGNTHATSESSYDLSPDGLSIAKARVDYLFRKNNEPAS